MAKDVGDPNCEVYGAAVVLLRHYLGDEFIATKVRIGPKPDLYMLNRETDETDDRFMHMTRVAEFAEFLFLLRGSPGFDVLCERLQTRDTQASVADAQAASAFCSIGFRVEI